jgi:hypothetical protein
MCWTKRLGEPELLEFAHAHYHACPKAVRIDLRLEPSGIRGRLSVPVPIWPDREEKSLHYVKSVRQLVSRAGWRGVHLEYDSASLDRPNESLRNTPFTHARR